MLYITMYATNKKKLKDQTKYENLYTNATIAKMPE